MKDDNYPIIAQTLFYTGSNLWSGNWQQFSPLM